MFLPARCWVCPGHRIGSSVRFRLMLQYSHVEGCYPRAEKFAHPIAKRAIVEMGLTLRTATAVSTVAYQGAIWRREEIALQGQRGGRRSCIARDQ